jgi:hypothetical protein
MKMDVIHSSAILVTIYKIAWHHNTEDFFTAMRTSNLRQQRLFSKECLLLLTRRNFGEGE